VFAKHADFLLDCWPQRVFVYHEAYFAKRTWTNASELRAQLYSVYSPDLRLTKLGEAGIIVMYLGTECIVEGKSLLLTSDAVCQVSACS
jgi:hypothetical protein